MSLPRVTKKMEKALAGREEQTKADLAWLAFRHSAIRCYTDHAPYLHAAVTPGSGPHAGRLCFVPMPTPESLADHPETCWRNETLKRFKRTFKPFAPKKATDTFNHYVNQVVVVFGVAILESFFEDAYEIRGEGATLKTPMGQSRSLRTYISIVNGWDPTNLHKPRGRGRHFFVADFKAKAKHVTDVMGLAKKRNQIVHAQGRKTVGVAINHTMRQLEHAVEFVSDTVDKFLNQATPR